jgi:hypothetical protein
MLLLIVPFRNLQVIWLRRLFRFTCEYFMKLRDCQSPLDTIDSGSNLDVSRGIIGTRGIPKCGSKGKE